MVTLFLRKFTHAVYELECLAKVGKRERLRDVVLFDNAPAIHLPLQGDEFLTLERRDTSPAGYACFGCKGGHRGDDSSTPLTSSPHAATRREAD